MKKKLTALALAAVMMLMLAAGCARSETDHKIAMVTDSASVSDNHLNQAVWQGLELIADEYGADINFFRPSGPITDNFMEGVDTLIENGYDVIVFPGALFTETLERACAAYPDCIFVGIDCDMESVPSNAVTVSFDKSQAGFLAGLAAAIELDGKTFGCVLGSSSPFAEELVSGLMQGVEYAREHYGSTAVLSHENMVLLDDTANYPLGQQQAAMLFDSGVDCILVSSDPTGLGAAAEARMRALMGDEVYIIGSDADMYVTAEYDTEKELSCAVTSAMSDYSAAICSVAKDIIVGGDAQLGKNLVFDLGSGSVGLPEENPSLSQEALDAAADAAKKISSGELVVANMTASSNAAAKN